ncbi:MAG: hypothetical protein V3U03_04700 [Myxococcota bacterium]
MTERARAAGPGRAAQSTGGGAVWRARLRRALLAGIGLLYAISIPWYRTAGEDAELVWGLPDWVAVALGCYVGVALLNAVAWLLTEVPDAPTEGSGGSR